MYERDQRNLVRCKSLAEKVDELCKRLNIYRNAENAERIDQFVKKIAQKNATIKNAMNKLDNQKVQIKNVIAKSSPERALDPQMEPIITRFSENTEEVFNNLFDNITDIRNFESTLQSDVDVAVLFALTDSMLQDASLDLKGTEPGADVRRQFENAQKLQAEARALYKKGDRKNALLKTKDAYYTALAIIPEEKDDFCFDCQYTRLKEDIAKVDTMVGRDKCEITQIKTLLKLSKQHAEIAGEKNESKDLKNARKELDISSLLITRTLNRLLAHIEEHKKASEESDDEEE